MNGQHTEPFDMVGWANDTLSRIHKPLKRWVPCEMCDSQGYNLKWVGVDGWREQTERDCEHCEDGYVQVEEGDSRWDEGDYLHPDE